MIDSQHPLLGTFNTLNGITRADGMASIFAVTSPFSKCGTSYVTRQLSIIAAHHHSLQGGRVALIDMDIYNQSHAAAFDRPQSIEAHGSLTGPFDATFGQAPFWKLSTVGEQPHSANATTDASHCGLFFVGELGLAVSGFDWSAITEEQTVEVVPAPNYWQSAREQFSMVLIDCPSTDRTEMSMSVIPYCDSTIIVCPEGRQTDPAVLKLSERITQSGGACAGIVLNVGKPNYQLSGRIS